MTANLEKRDFFVAAFRILQDADPSAVTVNALCNHLHVTKGSYFHHFTSREDFVSGLSEWWESKWTRLFAEYYAAKDRDARIELIVNCTARLPHRAEAGLRSWSNGEPTILAAQTRVGGAGEKMLSAAISEYLTNETAARSAARQGIAIAVGLQHQCEAIGRAEYLEVIADWIAPCLGVTADIFMTHAGPTFWVERGQTHSKPASGTVRQLKSREGSRTLSLLHRRQA